jgi:hypothetical protein
LNALQIRLSGGADLTFATHLPQSLQKRFPNGAAAKSKTARLRVSQTGGLGRQVDWGLLA